MKQVKVNKNDDDDDDDDDDDNNNLFKNFIKVSSYLLLKVQT
jgi:hypothetical protein